MKVVINACHGGFSISKKCAEYMAERGHERARLELQESVKPLDPNVECDAIYLKHGATVRRFFGFGHVEGMEGAYERNDLLLVAAVEALGAEANGRRASLKIVEIPDNIAWAIEESEGFELVAEAHRTWQ